MVRVLIVACAVLIILLTGATAAALYLIWSHSQPAGAVSEPMTTLSPKAVKREFDRGNVLFLDARGRASYQAGHIPGALHLPAEASEERRREVLAAYPPGTRVITYCSGIGCRSSGLLAQRLREEKELNLGQIHVLDGGFPAWKRAGYPVATGRQTEP